MQPEIRPAKKEDLQELAHVHIESWKAAYGHFMPAYVFEWITTENRVERFKESLEKENEELAVITVEGKIAGSITQGKCRDEDSEDNTGEIWGMYLLPGYWWQGLGTKLVNWSLEKLKEKGYRRVTLWVFEESTGSRQFYEKLGFKPEGETRPTRIDDSIRLIRYIKELMPPQRQLFS